MPGRVPRGAHVNGVTSVPGPPQNPKTYKLMAMGYKTLKLVAMDYQRGRRSISCICLEAK